MVGVVYLISLQTVYNPDDYTLYRDSTGKGLCFGFYLNRPRIRYLGDFFRCQENGGSDHLSITVCPRGHLVGSDSVPPLA